MIDFEKLSEEHAARVAARRSDPKPLLAVVSCKTPMAQWPISSWHYIGRSMGHSPVYRGSALANVFHQKDYGREQAIELYRSWLLEKVRAEDREVMRELDEILAYSLALDGLALGCWCKPLACHGDVIVRCVNWLWSQGRRPSGWTVESIR